MSNRMMNRKSQVAVWVLVPVCALMRLPAQVTAVSQVEDNPVVQCAEGVQLLLDGQYAEALSLLEAGFAGREGVTFDDPDDLGICAPALRPVIFLGL